MELHCVKCEFHYRLCYVAEANSSVSRTDRRQQVIVAACPPWPTSPHTGLVGRVGPIPPTSVLLLSNRSKKDKPGKNRTATPLGSPPSPLSSYSLKVGLTSRSTEMKPHKKVLFLRSVFFFFFQQSCIARPQLAETKESSLLHFLHLNNSNLLQ